MEVFEWKIVLKWTDILKLLVLGILKGTLYMITNVLSKRSVRLNDNMFSFIQFVIYKSHSQLNYDFRGLEKIIGPNEWITFMRSVEESNKTEKLRFTNFYYKHM